ncbi:uncharacterized protein LOC121404126 [Drosophila obscura]|uniref:uncharacterized protein LOC121404126 n=1 Tax=Drosophila obscura TaxID=7282 RepID=UPI001BB24B15|nr:uncharacterized protein LOC121404126 [Drosophila obscura]
MTSEGEIQFLTGEPSIQKDPPGIEEVLEQYPESGPKRLTIEEYKARQKTAKQQRSEEATPSKTVPKARRGGKQARLIRTRRLLIECEKAARGSPDDQRRYKELLDATKLALRDAKKRLLAKQTSTPN